MATVIRNVGDINPNDRQALEHVLGHGLHENQQLVIQILNLPVSPAAADTVPSTSLPEWCNVYAGLSDEEIVDIEKVILTRADLSRPF